MQFMPLEHTSNNNNFKKYWWLREALNTLFPGILAYVRKTST